MSSEPAPRNLHDPQIFRAKALRFRSNPVIGVTGIRMGGVQVVTLLLANCLAIASLAWVAFLPITVTVEADRASPVLGRGTIVSPPGDCTATTSPAEAGPGRVATSGSARPCARRIRFRHLYQALLR